MKRKLSDYFSGAAAKVITSGEIDRSISNAHEFWGVSKLKAILGELGDERIEFATQFLYLTDNENEFSSEPGKLTWYDARAAGRLKGNTARSEARLYFTGNAACTLASAGDSLFLLRLEDDAKTQSQAELLAIVTPAQSTIGNQLHWLLGIDLPSSEEDSGYKIQSNFEFKNQHLDWVRNLILEAIGIRVELEEPGNLEQMLATFSDGFPTTNVFSAFARESFGEINACEDPDFAISAWIAHEEILFRALENQIVASRLKTGFEDDVDGFVSFSLSVLNRRKARAGLALENHLEEIFKLNDIRYSRGARTENRSKPDFLFPSEEHYRDQEYSKALLTMLGVKSTCKDRWRQVLPEAARIEQKHLFTLESAISANQTDEMRAHCLQLVVPQPLHETYNNEQSKWLFSLSDFLKLVKDRQANGGSTEQIG